MPWAAIVGGTQAESAEVAKRVAVRLRSGGRAVGGFVQCPLGDPGEPRGFEVEDLRTGVRLSVALRPPGGSGCYVFDPEALRAASAWLEDPAIDVVFVGTVGRHEAAGEGWWPAVKPLLARKEAALPVLCVRARALAPIALALPDPVAAIELPATDEEVEDFARALGAQLRSL